MAGKPLIWTMTVKYAMLGDKSGQYTGALPDLPNGATVMHRCTISFTARYRLTIHKVHHRFSIFLLLIEQLMTIHPMARETRANS